MRSPLSRVLALCLAALVLADGALAQSRMDPAKIRQAQAKLFEANYLSRLPNGKFEDKTAQALKMWQRDTNRPQTGALTEDEFNALMRFDTGRRAWEALSGSGDGSWFGVWGYKSGVDAARRALFLCQKKSSKPNNCSYIANASDRSGPGWSAAIFCKKAGLLGGTAKMFLHNGLSRKSAVDQAMAAAKASGFPVDKCELVKTLDGRGNQ